MGSSPSTPRKPAPTTQVQEIDTSAQEANTRNRNRRRQGASQTMLASGNNGTASYQSNQQNGQATTLSSTLG